MYFMQNDDSLKKPFHCDDDFGGTRQNNFDLNEQDVLLADMNDDRVIEELKKNLSQGRKIFTGELRKILQTVFSRNIEVEIDTMRSAIEMVLRSCFSGGRYRTNSTNLGVKFIENNINYPLFDIIPHFCIYHFKENMEDIRNKLIETILDGMFPSTCEDKLEAIKTCSEWINKTRNYECSQKWFQIAWNIYHEYKKNVKEDIEEIETAFEGVIRAFFDKKRFKICSDDDINFIKNAKSFDEIGKMLKEKSKMSRLTKKNLTVSGFFNLDKGKCVENWLKKASSFLPTERDKELVPELYTISRKSSFVEKDREILQKVWNLYKNNKTKYQNTVFEENLKSVLKKVFTSYLKDNDQYCYDSRRPIDCFIEDNGFLDTISEFKGKKEEKVEAIINDLFNNKKPRLKTDESDTKENKKPSKLRSQDGGYEEYSKQSLTSSLFFAENLESSNSDKKPRLKTDKSNTKKNKKPSKSYFAI